MREINSPLSESDVRSLNLGDVVFLNGQVVTARDAAHIRALELSKKGEDVPACLEGAAVYHCGPIMSRSGYGPWTVVAAGPTTSARMNGMEPEFIRRFGVRAIIGKGGMSEETAAAMAEVGCVYLAATGGTAVSLAKALSKVRGVEWEDLGMAEALWKFDAYHLGPLVVAIDSEGNSLYDRVKENLVKNYRSPSTSFSSSLTFSTLRYR